VLCFVALQAYPVLLGIPGSHGGAEVQQVLLARALVERGHRVSLVSFEHGGPADMTRDGIRVVSVLKWSWGFPGTRFFPRVWQLWRAMERAGGAVYLYQCASPLIGIVAAFCRTRRRKFIFQTASVNDVDGGYPRRANPRDRWLYRLGIRWADGIIVQAEEHRRLLAERCGRDSFVIMNGHPLPPRPAGPGPGRFVLWVGMVRAVKGPRRFFELARLLPDTRFVLVGGNDIEPDYMASVEREAATIPNVELRGFQPRSKVLEILGEALCLVNTSDHEGFPNTFIEAWSVGVPVISLRNDPDGVVRRRGLGEVAESLPEMAEGIVRMAGSPELRAQLFERCRSYCESEHDIARVIEKYEDAFRAVTNPAAARRE
jgi:glycosyltransferase involved in cell wall biosynthesis